MDKRKQIKYIISEAMQSGTIKPLALLSNVKIYISEFDNIENIVKPYIEKDIIYIVSKQDLT